MKANVRKANQNWDRQEETRAARSSTGSVLLPKQVWNGDENLKKAVTMFRTLRWNAGPITWSNSDIVTQEKNRQKPYVCRSGSLTLHAEI